MNALNIALKDLQIFFRDRGAVIQLFVLPLVFIVVFSGALSAVGGEGEDARILLPVVDLDGGPAAQTLLQNLDAAGGVRIERYAQEQANASLDENKIARVLTVPADFSSGLAEGRQVTLRLVSHPDANPEETEAVRLVIEGVAGDMALQSQILASLQQMGDMQAGEPEASSSFAVERMQAQARSQFDRSQTRPLVAVLQTVPGQEAVREEIPDLDELAVPGFAVLFMFITAQTTARSIYDEKKVGSFRRLLASPMSKASLLAGKMLPNFLMGLLQAAVIFAFGVYGLRLLGLRAVSLGNTPLGVALVVVLIALCSSTFGILIAAIARTENQIGGLSTLLLWCMATVGGCVIPLVFLENFVGPLIRIVPHYWANRAFDHLMVRGLGLADVAVEMAVLLAFSVLFFAVGLWRFEFE